MKNSLWSSTLVLLLASALAAQDPYGRRGDYPPPVLDGANTSVQGGKVIVDLEKGPPGPGQGKMIVDLENGRPPVLQQQDQLSNYGLSFGWQGAPPPSSFRAGTWVGTGLASTDFGIFADNVRMWGLHVGGGYYFEDNLSLNIELLGLYGDRLYRRSELDVPVITPDGVLPAVFEGVPRGDEAPFFGIATQGFLRYHFLNYGTWSMFGEAGLGFAYTSKSVPTDGTNYNFILTAGVGITKQLDECTHLILGGRWFHFSNGAFFTDENPGYDGKTIYAGLLFGF